MSVHQRRSELSPDAWIFHYNYAPAHDVLTVQELLAKKLIFTLNHPSYFPNFASAALAVSKNEDHFEGPQIF
jgi:hypothetical protein